MRRSYFLNRNDFGFLTVVACPVMVGWLGCMLLNVTRFCCFLFQLALVKMYLLRKLVVSVTKLGDFFKFVVTNFLSKVVQILGELMCDFANDHFLLNTAVEPYGLGLGKFCYFLSNSWSHWTHSSRHNLSKMYFKCQESRREL